RRSSCRPCARPYQSPYAPSLVDEFDNCDIRSITGAMAKVTNTRVAARPLNVARPDLTEKLRQRIAIMDVTRHQPACVQVAALRPRDQRLGKLPQLLRLRRRRLDATMQEQ